VPVPELVICVLQIFGRVFNSVFGRDTQKPGKIGFRCFGGSFVKNFRHDFFAKRFFVVVFLNSHRRETPENAIRQKKNEEDLAWSFRHGLFVKIFVWCF
jgi:hypothetical protein